MKISVETVVKARLNKVWDAWNDPADQSVARALVAAIERWALDRGCREVASDASLANHVSHTVHRALGFEETERVVFFRKPLE